jgi:hypothetical protein
MRLKTIGRTLVIGYSELIYPFEPILAKQALQIRSCFDYRSGLFIQLNVVTA